MGLFIPPELCLRLNFDYLNTEIVFFHKKSEVAMQARIRNIFLMIFLTGSLSLLFSADWVCLGGNVQRTYTSPDTLKPPLKLLWRNREPEGSTMTEPVAAAGKVFTRTLDGVTVCALDLNTGDLIWKIHDHMDGFWPGNREYNGWNTGLLYYAGRIYYQTSTIDGRLLICRNASTGDSLWARALGGSAAFWLSSPVAWDSVVYCEAVYSVRAVGDTVYYYAFNAMSGAPVWVRKYPGYQLPAALSIDTVKGRLFGGMGVDTAGRDGFFFAAPLSTGDTTLWTHHFIWPAAQHDVIFTSYCRDTLAVSGYSTSITRLLDANTGVPYKIFTTSNPSYGALIINEQVTMRGNFYGYTFLYDRLGNAIGNSQTIHRDAEGRCGRPAMSNGYVWRAGSAGRGYEKSHGVLSAFCLNTLKGSGPCQDPPLWIEYTTDAWACVTPVICGDKVILQNAGGSVTCYQQEK